MAKSATRELELDTRVLEPWEIGARLHMLLIAPGASEKRMRDLVTSACADQIRISAIVYFTSQADSLGWPPAMSTQGSELRG